ncbi:hypothetical protein M9H77_23743 [Catharanthus roseus]|uniref:Uncharacterized protein n=1 Tax=Catharanthus roseus TaxID=4058 RepID=A0ACC0AU68_CATRO|nr:hypothetical protein M9H77_23743 [Catharanthus roseus]
MLMEIIIGTDALLKRRRLLKFLFLEVVLCLDMSPRDLVVHLKTLEILPNLEEVDPIVSEDTGILPTYINFLVENNEDTVQSPDFVSFSISELIIALVRLQAPNPLPLSIGRGKALEEQPFVTISQHGVNVIKECQN